MLELHKITIEHRGPLCMPRCTCGWYGAEFGNVVHAHRVGTNHVDAKKAQQIRPPDELDL